MAPFTIANQRDVIVTQPKQRTHDVAASSGLDCARCGRQPHRVGGTCKKHELVMGCAATLTVRGAARFGQLQQLMVQTRVTSRSRSYWLDAWAFGERVLVRHAVASPFHSFATTGLSTDLSSVGT